MKLMVRNIITMLLCTVSISAARELPAPVHEKIISYFAGQFEVEETDVFVEYREPAWELPAGVNFEIDSRNLTPRAGSQLIWINQMKDQRIVNRLPLNVRVAVMLDVCIIENDISRGKVITMENIAFQPVKIDRNYDKLIRDFNEVKDLAARNNLRSGEFLTRSDLMEKPDIRRGESLKIRYMAGDLMIESAGTARSDGTIGSELRAVCETSRQQVTGVLTAAKILTVKLK